MIVFSNGLPVSDIQLNAESLHGAVRELEAERDRLFWEAVAEAQRTLPESELVEAYREIVSRIGLPPSLRLRPLDTRGVADILIKRTVRVR